MAAEPEEQKKSNKDSSEEEDDIASRFPDVEKDERLRAARADLPPVPEARFERPQTKTANPPTPGEGGKFRAGGSFVGNGDLRGMGQASTIGISLAASIFIGAGFGWLLDHFVIKSATPWGLIGGFLLGVLSGFINLVRVANRLNRDDK